MSKSRAEVLAILRTVDPEADRVPPRMLKFAEALYSHSQQYEDGHAVGYEQGFSEGMKSGERIGYRRGHDAGLAEGRALGTDDGLRRGRALGRDEAIDSLDDAVRGWLVTTEPANSYTRRDET